MVPAAEERATLAASGQRLGMLLNIVKCSEQHPEETASSTPKYYSAAVDSPGIEVNTCHSI